MIRNRDKTARAENQYPFTQAIGDPGSLHPPLAGPRNFRNTEALVSEDGFSLSVFRCQRKMTFERLITVVVRETDVWEPQRGARPMTGVFQSRTEI